MVDSIVGFISPLGREDQIGTLIMRFEDSSPDGSQFIAREVITKKGLKFASDSHDDCFLESWN